MRRPLAAAGLLALGLLLVSPAPLGAARRPGGTLKQKRTELSQVRRQLDQARARASAARSREVSLLAELERLDRTLLRKRAEIRRLDGRIRRVEAELEALGDRRGRVAEELVVQRADLAARLRAVASLRSHPGAPAWIGERDEPARAQALEDLVRITRVEVGRLTQAGETAARLRAREDAVARGRRELLTLRRAVDAERGALDREAERRRGLLAEVRDDRATHERMAAELEEAGRRLEALVRELSRRVASRPAVARPADPAGPRPPAVGLGALRGQLPWPTEGRIAAGFGRQVHPRFGTETFRRGVDIQAEEGAWIRAVYAGTVLYRGWLKGYGNLIVLDHGAGYYTVYAHASELLAAEGERVKAGEGIARVGETGSLEGPRLYFEIRYQGRPEDPEQWLRRRS